MGGPRVCGDHGALRRHGVVARLVPVIAVALASGLCLLGWAAGPAGATGGCRAKPAPHVNLAGCDLEGDNLTGANLTDANLEGANLTDAVVSNVTLAGTTLAGATLSGVSSGGVVGLPASLPTGWTTAAGYLVGP